MQSYTEALCNNLHLFVWIFHLWNNSQPSINPTIIMQHLNINMFPLLLCLSLLMNSFSLKESPAHFLAAFEDPFVINVAGTTSIFPQPLFCHQFLFLRLVLILCQHKNCLLPIIETIFSNVSSNLWNRLVSYFILYTGHALLDNFLLSCCSVVASRRPVMFSKNTRRDK